MKYTKYFLTPILIFSINIESQNNTIGEVDLGSASNSDAFNHICCLEENINQNAAYRQCLHDFEAQWREACETDP